MCGGGGKTPEVKETAAERALAETSAKKFQDYQANFVPLENQYMERVEQIGSDTNIDKVGANAQAGAAKEFSGLRSKMDSQSFARNLDPTSGAYQNGSREVSNTFKRAVDDAGNNGRFAAENSYIQGLGNIVAIGNGQDTTAFNSMGALASQATNEAITDAKVDFYNKQSDEELKGAVVGGLTSYGLNYAQNNAGALNTVTGSKYDTGLFSEQSRMLAAQERGMG